MDKYGHIKKYDDVPQNFFDRESSKGMETQILTFAVKNGYSFAYLCKKVHKKWLFFWTNMVKSKSQCQRNKSKEIS